MPRLLACTTVAGAAAELVAFPCSHAWRRVVGPMVRSVLLSCSRTECSPYTVPAVSTIHRDEPQGPASGELVLSGR